MAASEARTKALKAELAKIEKQVKQFLDRVTATDVPSVIAAYEDRICELGEQRLLLLEKM